MSGSTLTQHAGQPARLHLVPPQAPRFGRLRRNVKLALGLAAIYGPVAPVLTTHAHLISKAYLVLGIWAIEGILWSLADARPRGAGSRASAAAR